MDYRPRGVKLYDDLAGKNSTTRCRFAVNHGLFMKLLIAVLCYRVPDLTIDCLNSLSEEIGRIPDANVAICENGTGGDAAERNTDRRASQTRSTCSDRPMQPPTNARSALSSPTRTSTR